MTPAALLAWYGGSAVLLSLVAVLFVALERWGGPGRTPERWLRWVWALLALALLLPALWPAVGARSTSGAPFEIWGGPSVDGGAPAPARVTLRWVGGSQARRAGLPIRQRILDALLLLIAGGALAASARLAWRRRDLGRSCAALPVVKAAGRVRVCASDEAPAPFTARALGHAFIVVPTSLLADHRRLRIVIAHEAHHHRRFDLHTAALLGALHALFFWNPMLAVWSRFVAELQDHACDRHVLGRRRVAWFEYGRVLLWAAAEAAGDRRHVWSGARSMAGGAAGSLRRRVLMLNDMGTKTGRLRAWIVGVAACAATVGTSFALQSAVVDHRVGRAEIEAVAARVEQRSGFPVLVDDQVLAKLNEWVADPVARGATKSAIARMPAYRPLIERTLRERTLPVELVGMALAESAFDNEAHPDRPAASRAAGIWQIIPSTGRRLGLSVSPENDERLDPRKATEAAATLLSTLMARYGDWPVAIAAYNAGERKIDALTEGAPSKGAARERVLAGDNEHARYVRAVMASVILIEEPSLLR